MLRDVILTGLAKPDFVVSHRISIEDIPATSGSFLNMQTSI